MGHLDAVDVGQAEVKDDDIGVPAAGQLEGSLAVGGHVHVVAPGSQPDVEGAAHGQFVLNDQDPAGLGGGVVWAWLWVVAC